MEEEGQAGLRELARMPDVLVVCSSAGWTDQKHMLYLALLQESFVNQLHDGEISFRGLFKQTPSKAARAKPCVKAVQTGPPSPCCGNQGDGEAHSMDDDDDDDASSSETVRESSDKASATSSGRSSPRRFGRRRRSPSRTATAEGSDQNFIDEDAITREIGESRGRRRGNKRLKIC